MSLHAHGVPAAVVCGPPLLPSELLWLVALGITPPLMPKWCHLHAWFVATWYHSTFDAEALGITPPLMPKWCHLHAWFVATPTCSLDGAAQQKVAGSEIYHGSFGVRFAYIYIYIFIFISGQNIATPHTTSPQKVAKEGKSPHFKEVCSRAEWRLQP